MWYCFYYNVSQLIDLNILIFYWYSSQSCRSYLSPDPHLVGYHDVITQEIEKDNCQ